MQSSMLSLHRQIYKQTCQYRTEIRKVAGADTGHFLVAPNPSYTLLQLEPTDARDYLKNHEHSSYAWYINEVAYELCRENTLRKSEVSQRKEEAITKDCQVSRR